MQKTKTLNPYTYSKGEAAGYLVGLTGQNMIYNIVATGLYYYFQNVICLPAMALSMIMLFARIWDAVNDPMMGTIVDKTKSKWGKCKPYLLFAPPLICVITILTFLNKNYALASTSGEEALIITWAAVSYVMWGMSYTIGDIPLWGVTSLMTQDENDRAKLLALARIFAGIGGIAVLIVQIAQAVSQIYVNKGFSQEEASQKGFILTAIILTLISSIMFEFAGLSVHERVAQSEKHYTLVENFKTMFTNKPFRQILISGILRSPIQLLSIVGMTLVTYYFANGDFMNIFTTDASGKIVGIDTKVAVDVIMIAIGLLIGMFVGSGATPALTKKIEKYKLYNFYSVGGAVPFALIFVLFEITNGNLKDNYILAAVTAVLIFLASWSMGGLNVLQSVMIADCIDYEEYTNGVRTDGVFFSGQSFVTKLGAGIASLISGVIYNAVGYSGKAINTLNNDLHAGADFVTYADGKYAMAMFLLISVPPAIGLILSAIPTWKYALPDKEHSRILSELIEKRKAKAQNQDTLADH